MSLTLWDDLLPQLRRWLSVGPLRPHLKRRGLLTDEEYDGLLSRVEEPPGVQAEHLVVILRKKGRQGPNLFLQALQVGTIYRVGGAGPSQASRDQPLPLPCRIP